MIFDILTDQQLVMSGSLKNRPTRRQQSISQLVSDQLALAQSLTPLERQDEMKKYILGDTELVDGKTLDRANAWILTRRREMTRKVFVSLTCQTKVSLLNVVAKQSYSTKRDSRYAGNASRRPSSRTAYCRGMCVSF